MWRSLQFCVVNRVVILSAKAFQRRYKGAEACWYGGLDERLVEYGWCVCILCACMSVVKAYVVFGADEAPVRGKTGQIGCSALLPSSL